MPDYSPEIVDVISSRDDQLIVLTWVSGYAVFQPDADEQVEKFRAVLMDPVANKTGYRFHSSVRRYPRWYCEEQGMI